MTSEKARTERIQRVYASKDYGELTSEYEGGRRNTTRT